MEQSNANVSLEREPITLVYDLGTFEGFNFRAQGAIERLLSEDDVVNWDHDREGEAEFWPSGENPGVSLVFRHSTVTASELVALDRLLQELGNDLVETYLRIHYAVNNLGKDITELTAETVEDQNLHIFEGNCFLDLRRDAAFELFELYYPEEYRVWEKSLCDGLNFDTDHFLDSPSWSVSEIQLGERKFLVIAS